MNLKFKNIKRYMFFILILVFYFVKAEIGIADDYNDIVGKWKIVQLEQDATIRQPLGIVFNIFSEKTIVTTDGTRSQEVNYIIRPNKNPKEIDQSLIHEDRTITSLGIYSLNDDELKMCFALDPSAPRPKKLSTMEGDGLVVFILNRLDSDTKIEPPEANLENVKTLKNLGAIFELDNNSRIRTVSLFKTKITDADLLSLVGLEQMDTLSLMGTDITDAGLSTVGKLTQLKNLNLSMTGISDAGLANLVTLKNLEELLLAFTGVSKNGVLKLKGLQNLKEIDLSLTNVKATEIKELENAMPNCKFIFPKLEK